ncbi:MAG: hypothetical protein ABIE14_03525, partial [Patescibacteria group bacterium]
LGIYSFMAACGKLEIFSKLKKDKNAQMIEIKREQFDTKEIENVQFPDPKITKYSYSSGTKVVLSEFDKSMWKQIDTGEIQNEIEKHFELLLARKNLQIKLISQNGEEYICKPFDYNQYEGEEYRESLKELHFIKGRKYPKKVKLIVPKPINIFLKVTKGKAINKPPVFMVKGRRIAEVKDIKQFKSKHKPDIWGHPNMTGYIDLSDYLEPTIARNDFKNNDKSKALFDSLEELELLILEFVKDVNKESADKHYKKFEDKLNSIFSKLSKKLLLNYRTKFLSGNEINLQKGGSGQSFNEGFGGKDRGENNKGVGGEGWGGENEGEGSGPSGEVGNDISSGKGEGDFASDKEADNPFEDTGFKGGEKKKSGFNIQINNNEPPTNENNEILRSQLIGGDIRIFRKHPDFQKRIKRSRVGNEQISQSLITYVAGQVTVHSMDKFYTKNGQPEYNKNMFDELVDYIYEAEFGLQECEGQNLSDFNE